VTLTYYAVKHSSGNYLTDHWQGSSYWEGEEGKGAPKLFKSLGSAKGWRTQWLKGRVIKEYAALAQDSFFQGEEFVGYSYEPVPSRSLSCINIIPVTLSFGEPL